MKFKKSYGKIKKGINDNFIVFFILIFYLSESISKIILFTTGHESLIARIIKISALLFILYHLFITRDYKFLTCILIIILCFVIGQYFINESYSSNSIVILGRYLYPILLFRFFRIKQHNKQNIKLLFNVFENLLVFNSLLIILGLFFDIYIFETYRGNRFGYNGLLLTSATSSYVYIITLFYFVLKYRTNSKIDFKMIVIVLSSLLIGTKSIYLAFIVLLFYIIYVQFSSKKGKVISSILMVFMAFCVFYLIFYKIEPFNLFREKKGLLSAVLSYRNDLLFKDLIPYVDNNWSFVNYLFGGVSDFTTHSEMGFIDIFYFWGFVGGSTYLILYCKSFISFKLDKTLLFFLIILVIIIFLAGNFFFYSTIPIYLVVFRERVNIYLKNKF